MGDLAVRFEELSESNVDLLKQLNGAIFPINYPDQVYRDALACGVTQLAFIGDTLVGAIACRLENMLQGPRLYIMTLGVLAPYRGRGIGSGLVQHLLAVVQEGLPEVQEAYLHVQISNEEAMVFYERLGFDKGEIIEHYYRRIDPPHALILRRQLGPPG